MSTRNNRNFSCKDEELTVISGFVAFSLKRDLVDFSAFSPKFTTDYVTGFETKISNATELVEPESETLAKKLITERYTTAINGLTGSMNKLSGYLKLASASLKITDAGFGLSAVRKSINSNDVEGVIANLRIVLKNIDTYKAPLAEMGLTDEFVSAMSTTLTSVAADKQQQYGITSNRKAIVQNNVSSLNVLYDQLNEIMAIGKVLYKGTDAAKLADYTLAQLLKKVRQSSKAPAKVATETEAIN